MRGVRGVRVTSPTARTARSITITITIAVTTTITITTYLPDGSDSTIDDGVRVLVISNTCCVDWAITAPPVVKISVRESATASYATAE